MFHRSLLRGLAVAEIGSAHQTEKGENPILPRKRRRIVRSCRGSNGSFKVLAPSWDPVLGCMLLVCCVCMAVLLRVWYLFIEHSGKSSHPCNLAGCLFAPRNTPKTAVWIFIPTGRDSARRLCCVVTALTEYFRDFV
ncbi:hypothetical protein FVEG_14776 [Fusarium verticillioides 7600]|uniref:Uncharacterized protein n=1 Tax=Gibberella moniliformis (strain M3125 / FGSC 7600) TaxID=334819 RepID=W7LG13_GIBM7|nr:hypothetical protein FVEG_14776 [Fusarium verticillioides 7600]EWG37511.1 hypothetical protein FVEG_14776 [Fusarium verticillioides 7600]